MSRRSVASTGSGDVEAKSASGMVLPFDPLALSFHDLNYFVPLPPVSVCISAIVVCTRFISGLMALTQHMLGFCPTSLRQILPACGSYVPPAFGSYGKQAHVVESGT